MLCGFSQLWHACRCVWCRYCSVSSFDITGGSPSAINAHPFEVAAELVYSGQEADELLCEDPPVPNPKTGASPPNPTGSPTWWPWGHQTASSGTGTNADSDSDADKAGVEKTQGDSIPVGIFENKIVLAKRGKCMFEDKALVAARQGAAGIIIYNFEDALFIMAGKKDSGTAGRHDKESQLLREFPAVMLTKTDAEAVMKMMTWLRRQNLSPVYEVIVTSTPMSLDLPSMGSFVYPKVHVKDKIIVVYSREEWGVVLTNAATVGQEWQLFVLRRADLGSLTPWKMASPAGLDMSATPQFSHNPTELYSRILSRKCPSILSVNADHGNAIALRRPSKKSAPSNKVIM